MLRGSSVSDPNSEAVNDLPPKKSPSVKYSVAIVNGAALLYIVFRILQVGIRRLLDGP